MEHIRCVVERITYQNEENGYSVIRCRVKNYSDLVTVVGSLPEVHVGSVLCLGGSWQVNPKYGRQFQMETFEETLPATVYGIEKYLGSGLVRGIGPKFAKRIVQQFGKDTLDVIEEDSDKLLDVPGIGKTRVERIKKSWEQQKETKLSHSDWLKQDLWLRLSKSSFRSRFHVRNQSCRGKSVFFHQFLPSEPGDQGDTVFDAGSLQERGGFPVCFQGDVFLYPLQPDRILWFPYLLHGREGGKKNGNTDKLALQFAKAERSTG